jgi:hypothetical protein
MAQQTKNEDRSDELDDGLEQSFPASDPVSIVQPQRPRRGKREPVGHEHGDSQGQPRPGDPKDKPQDA